MDKKNEGNRCVTFYEISGTTYEVETSFSGTERSNNKIIRLMLSEKIESKGKLGGFPWHAGADY